MPKVTHFEIYADDLKRAIKFYKNVFGWEAKKWDGPMDYWMITTDSDKEPGINGAVMERPEPNKCDDASINPSDEKISYVRNYKRYALWCDDAHSRNLIEESCNFNRSLPIL